MAASPTPRTSNVQAPTFQSVSGSGASVETILNLGTILPKIPLVDRKGRYTVVSADFWRAFRYFSRAGEVPRRRQGQADLPANLPSHGKKTDTAEFPPCLNLSKSLTEFAALETRKNPIRFFAAARTPQKTLCAQRSVAAASIAGQGVERSESRLVKKGNALFDQAQDSSIRSLSSSSPESLRNRSSRSSTVSFARSSPATSRTIFP